MTFVFGASFVDVGNNNYLIDLSLVIAETLCNGIVPLATNAKKLPT